MLTERSAVKMKIHTRRCKLKLGAACTNMRRPSRPLWIKKKTHGWNCITHTLSQGPRHYQWSALVLCSSSQRSRSRTTSIFCSLFCRTTARERSEILCVGDNLATNNNLCTLATLHLWPGAVLLCTYVICKSGPLWWLRASCYKFKCVAGAAELIYPFIIPGHLLKRSARITTSRFYLFVC